jgi:glycosyltransferase involved in cell wall biosynthesis
MPRFSIITVCYNASQSIAGTIASLRAQTHSDYEWVVVDGASKDDTVAQVLSSGIEPCNLMSEPDEGIYDAMNKAIMRARGDWLYFLNAGDAFANPDVLAQVASALQRHPDTDLLYGDMIYVNGERQWAEHFDHVRRSLLVFESLNHQAVFARRTLFARIGLFRKEYRVSADYDWLLRVFKSGASTRHITEFIARFEVGGTHQRHIPTLAREARAIRLQYVSVPMLWVGTQLARLRSRMRRASRVRSPLLASVVTTK